MDMLIETQCKEQYQHNAELPAHEEYEDDGKAAGNEESNGEVGREARGMPFWLSEPSADISADCDRGDEADHQNANYAGDDNYGGLSVLPTIAGMPAVCSWGPVHTARANDKASVSASELDPKRQILTSDISMIRAEIEHPKGISNDELGHKHKRNGLNEASGEPFSGNEHFNDSDDVCGSKICKFPEEGIDQDCEPRRSNSNPDHHGICEATGPTAKTLGYAC